MTIQNTTIRKAGPSQGNGVTTVFPFTFKVFTTADILVTYLDASSVESVLVLTTNYTVSLNADQNTSPGGSVTLLVAPATGTYITLTSQVANTQTLALTNSGGFYPESINNALDRTVIEIQQLAEQASRAVTIPKSSAANPLLPIPIPLNVLAWNVDGTAITNVSLESSSNLSSYKATGTGSVTRTVASKLNDTVSLLDFGADPTGVADSTTAFHNLILQAQAGKKVFIPKGTYLSSDITTTTNNDCTWLSSGWTGGINLPSVGVSNTQLITVQTPDTAYAAENTRVGSQIHAVAKGGNFGVGQYLFLDNTSTLAAGNTGLYAGCHTGTTAAWSSPKHGEIFHGGGTSVVSNNEVTSYTTSGALIGVVVNNGTSSASGTNYLTGASAVAHPTCQGILIQGGADPMGGWVAGLEVASYGMRTGGYTIKIGTTNTVTSHFYTTGSAISSVADIFLQGNSANGIILNGTYTGSAIRLTGNSAIAWEATGTIKTLWRADGSSLWVLQVGGTERFGIYAGSSPYIRLNSTQVVGIRDTGWTAMTGTTDKASAFATSTVTLAQLAGRVMAMQTALTTHGLLGA